MLAELEAASISLSHSFPIQGVYKQVASARERNNRSTSSGETMHLTGTETKSKVNYERFLQVYQESQSLLSVQAVHAGPERKETRTLRFHAHRDECGAAWECMGYCCLCAVMEN